MLQLTLIYEMLSLCFFRLCCHQTVLTIILFNPNCHRHVRIKLCGYVQYCQNHPGCRSS